MNIGVTGHRFLAEVERLQAGVDQALRRIIVAYPNEDWAILSSLAEGADRLVVKLAMIYPQYAHLIVPLPLPAEVNEQDFGSIESQQEFRALLAAADEITPLPPFTAREDGYWAAGLWILDHSDVLIALWDGQPSLGKGGTAQVVDEARRRGIPVAWVKCGNRKPGTQAAVSLGEEQGKVEFWGLPSNPRGCS